MSYRNPDRKELEDALKRKRMKIEKGDEEEEERVKAEGRWEG